MKKNEQIMKRRKIKFKLTIFLKRYETYMQKFIDYIAPLFVLHYFKIKKQRKSQWWWWTIYSNRIKRSIFLLCCKKISFNRREMNFSENRKIIITKYVNGLRVLCTTTKWNHKIQKQSISFFRCVVQCAHCSTYRYTNTYIYSANFATKTLWNQYSPFFEFLILFVNGYKIFQKIVSNQFFWSEATNSCHPLTHPEYSYKKKIINEKNPKNE